MLRALLYQAQTTLAEAVTRLNDMLAEHDLLTASPRCSWVLRRERAHPDLRLVRTGAGMILRKAADQVEELPPPGRCWGAFPARTFEAQVVPLACGDVLALFTDGLTEAGPSRKDLLGVPGVTSIFWNSAQNASSADQIKARMMEGVAALATATGIRDDVCLLIACVE
jgi:hypothetical protein